MGRIVVGVDGSNESRRALRWALDEARLRNATLEVVHAWTFAPVATAGGFVPYVTADVVEAIRLEAEKVVPGMLAEVKELTQGIQIDQAVKEGQAAKILVEAATGADLLVVGSRGHGGFAGLLLGSVSQQCAHHALCPVVIVPPEHDR